MPARDPRLPPPLPAQPEANPYAAPAALVADVHPGLSEAESVREAHIRHERQLKSIGALYYLGGVLMAFGTVAVGATLGQSGQAWDLGAGVMALYAVLTVVWIVMGYGFRKMRPWVRIPGGILSAIGLLAIPVGTLVSAWVLWAMFSAKGQVILSPSYDAIVAATPHIRYRWTIGDKIATVVLALIIAGFVAMFVLTSRG